MRDPVAESIRRKRYKVHNPFRSDLGARTPVEKEELVRRTTLAVLFTVMFHLALFLTLPFHFAQAERTPGKPPAKAIRLRLQTPPEPPEPQEDRFVETNPDIPQNKPNETRNFAARDQQAQQEIEAEELGPDPALEGELEDSQKVVVGSLFRPPLEDILGGAPELGRNQDSEEAEGVEALSPPSAPKAIEAEEADGEGLASWITPGEAEERPDKTQTMIVPLTMNPESAARQQLQGQPDRGAAVEAPKPLPRPRLVVPTQVGFGPLRDSARGLRSRTGRLAWDANFSEFGDYLQRMFDAVEIKWNELNLHAQKSTTEMNTFVRLQFYINKDGQVEDLEIARSTAGQAAEWRCIDAIKANTPYFPWTRDMVEVLGERQPVTITFHYR